jgi:hypothetical protein
MVSSLVRPKGELAPAGTHQASAAAAAKEWMPAFVRNSLFSVKWITPSQRRHHPVAGQRRMTEAGAEARAWQLLVALQFDNLGE